MANKPGIKTNIRKKNEKSKGKIPAYTLIDRELSWLAFNARVLQEAANKQVPLLERIKFLGIFSNNLDEFFRVRVAGVRRLLQLNKNRNNKDFKLLKKELEAIKSTVLFQQQEFARVYEDEILADLRKEGIFIVDESALTASEVSYVKDVFVNRIAGRISPLLLQHGKELPNIRDGEIYLAVSMRNSISGNTQFALVDVPSKSLGRFHVLPTEKGTKRIVLLDDMIRLGLPMLFSSLDFDEFTAHTIKITRDAELDIDNEVAISLLEKVAKSLKQRKTGAPTRFIYDREIPKDLLDFLTRKLKADKESTIPGGRYHNFRDFIKFPDVNRSDLLNPKQEITRIKEIDEAKSMLNLIQKRDLLLSYPYQPFDYIIRLLREAAIDPTVFAIRISLYRLAENSSIAEALINAIQNGKQVIVVMELRARFMEAHNIYWADRLREEGAYVIYGIPEFKVHSKLMVISRRVGFETTNIVHIGTGNFNEDTARLYCDHALLTSRKKIGEECLNVFDLIQNFRPEKARFKTLWVSPVNTRERFIAMLQREADFAAKGLPARAIIKINSLVDEASIKAIVEAANAGVKIDLIVRGICCLAIDENHPNIRAVSIIDKYLEHARVFYFENGGDPEVFIGSADLMQRNLQSRVEVTVPVQDKELKNMLVQVLETQLADNVKARVLDASMKNEMVKKLAGKKAVRSQVLLHSLFHDR
ncbi:MAG: polyphosphate kinase 1 [Sphingomonadales bacterium]|jgi:polyphosphate kinase